MTSVNYPTPILVNGFRCKNCTDVDYAKKHIDPQHPKDGPYGINRSGNAGGATTDLTHGPAVVIDGRIVQPASATDKAAGATSATQGVKVDVKVYSLVTAIFRRTAFWQTGLPSSMISYLPWENTHE